MGAAAGGRVLRSPAARGLARRGRELLRGEPSPHLADQIIPVLLGHANITQDHIGAEPAGLGHRFLAAAIRLEINFGATV